MVNDVVRSTCNFRRPRSERTARRRLPGAPCPPGFNGGHHQTRITSVTLSCELVEVEREEEACAHSKRHNSQPASGRYGLWCGTGRVPPEPHSRLEITSAPRDVHTLTKRPTGIPASLRTGVSPTTLSPPKADVKSQGSKSRMGEEIPHSVRGDAQLPKLCKVPVLVKFKEFTRLSLLPAEPKSKGLPNTATFHIMPLLFAARPATARTGSSTKHCAHAGS